MSQTDLTVEEVMESLTGFDEIAMEKHMGIDVYTQAEDKPVVMMRALVFVLLRRAGSSDADAHQTVQGMALKAVEEYFADDPDEPMPDEPVSAVGKDDSLPESRQTDSPASAS